VLLCVCVCALKENLLELSTPNFCSRPSASIDSQVASVGMHVAMTAVVSSIQRMILAGRGN